MPHLRFPLPVSRLPRSPFAPAKPGGRLFGIILVLTGVLLLAVAAAPVLVVAQSTTSIGPHDPGVRGGAAGAGGVIANATADEAAVFAAARETFKEVDSVSGAPIDGANGSGLGPRFNLDSCAGCHAFPDVGGTSPATNPQIAAAHRGNASNPESLPFIRANGPVREVRFVKNADGSPDGGVHDLFTITGRPDAAGCNLTQPDFGAAAASGNMIFRIPTPTFGAGFIEAIPDQAILDNKGANAGAKRFLGISGRENRNGNDGTITRFGWKAQNKSLLIFSGEAYNVEQGVTNEVFPDEREQAAGCQFNATPEDHSSLSVIGGEVSGEPGDAAQFAQFMRLLAPPQRGPISDSVVNGENKFNQVGCGLCHTPKLGTGLASSIDPNATSSDGLSGENARLFSDLLIHDMGQGLADGVSQGGANGQEFRSAPLWGVGQRIFFLHDGRTSDLLQAIRAHASRGSEANGVINLFNTLSGRDQQDILNFLRSL
jgi:CxxC motif-containing protein (DUF1111 family)